MHIAYISLTQLILNVARLDMLLIRLFPKCLEIVKRSEITRIFFNVNKQMNEFKTFSFINKESQM